jgi:hypothetical protein
MRKLAGAISFSIVLSQGISGQPAAVTTANRTQVVLLGTGTPRPEPARSGPATAIVVNDAAYLVRNSSDLRGQGRRR